MASIPTEQEDANAYPGIVQGTVRENAPIGDMLSLSDEKFNRFFSSLDDDKLLALEAMRGRHERRSQQVQSFSSPVASGSGILFGSPESSNSSESLRSMQEHIRDTNETVSKTSVMMAAIHRITITDKQTYQEGVFYNDAQTQRSEKSQRAFKDNLVSRYSNKANRTTKKGNVEVGLRCMVTGTVLPFDQCIAGHIVPHHAAAQLPCFGEVPSEINNPKNGLLWAQGIEDVFHPPKRVCIMYHFFTKQLHFMVLDPDLLEVAIKGTTIMFKNVNNRVVDCGDCSPSLRYLWRHASASIREAEKVGWLNAASEEWKVPLKMMEEAMIHVATDCDSQGAADKVASAYQPADRPKEAASLDFEEEVD